MDLPDNSLPQSSNTQSLAARILRNKNIILVVLILIMSSLSISILVTRQISTENALNKSKDAGTIVTTQATCLDGSTSNRVCDDLGNCYDSCPNQGAQNISTGNQVTPVQPTVRQKSLSEINAEAIANPGQTFCTTTGGGTQTCVVSDGKTTYSPAAYNNTYPPTATPRPATTNTGGSGGTSNNQQNSGDETAIANTPSPTKALSPTPNPYTAHTNYPSTTPTPTLKPCQMTHGGSYNPPTQENPCAMPTSGPTSTPKPTPTPVPPVPEGARCVTNRNRLTTCYDSSNNVVLTYTSDFETIILPSQAPNEARSAFTVYITSIGANRSLGQNDTPTGGQNLEFQFTNSQNQRVKTGVAQVTAKQAQTPTGMGYIGQISLGTEIPAGSYKAKFRLDNTLWKATTVALTPGTLITLPTLELIAGDIDQDNSIGLSDYNILLSCYGSKTCAQKDVADLNLDGKIDELDLNILYSSLQGNREGD